MSMKPHGNSFLNFLVLLIAVCLGPQASTQGQDANASRQLEVGQRAIDFELPIVNGDGYLSLSDTYKGGPTVVIFLRGYPGYQCPICLDGKSTRWSTAPKCSHQAAHRVVLVYPGQTRDSSASRRFHGSRGDCPSRWSSLRDDDHESRESVGRAMEFNPRETAYPATFVLDRYGRVAWKKVSRSHAERSSVEEILKELRKL